MIKVDLHMHSGEDPYDGLRYTAVHVIDRAVELGYAAIAVTLHEKVIEDERSFWRYRAPTLAVSTAAKVRM